MWTISDERGNMLALPKVAQYFHCRRKIGEYTKINNSELSGPKVYLCMTQAFKWIHCLISLIKEKP